ncbi:MAG TPA: hypothetical protein VE133_05845 [Candidatus Sulfotelmatobacter sp.]|nr:hypothetical protein [Candidatus Sulfotelmatobacter sp.]
MKPLRRNAAILALCSAVGVFFSGCEHKKPVLIVPQQAPPTAAASPSPTPEPQAQTASEQPQEQTPQTQTQAATPEQPKPDQAQAEKTKRARKPSPRKPAQQPAGSDKSTTEVARNTGGKKVIPAEKAEPTPSPGQISPGLPPATGAQNQAATEQLLQTAESNLNGIKRQLTRDEETVRTQIKEFINQSRKAITENDPARAHTLAVKARLLSDELVKQR